MRTNASNLTVITALKRVNKKHGYEITFNRFDIQERWVHFTLNSKSKIPGARISWTGRNLAKASWHAHGYLFDEILSIEPEAVIWSIGNKITIDSGNWIDKNMGSSIQPRYFSETSIL